MIEQTKFLSRGYSGIKNTVKELPKMYQLIGGELSPYTAKVRLYLRYKKIPFEPVQATAEIYSQFIKPKVGWNVIPVLVTPHQQVIQDSSDIISSLEKWHPTPSILPTSPKQRTISMLLELFCDEWMVMQIMHYRWSFPENDAFLKEEFGRIGFPRESVQGRSEIGAIMYQKFKGMLPILGITKKTIPVIEKSWKEMLVELTSHFDKHPYLLGGKPCLGDFSLAGMTYAHLFRDPASGFLMKKSSPVVCAWIEHMNGYLPHANKQALHHVDAVRNIVRDELPQHEFDFCQNDEIPETLLPILRRFFTQFGPILLSVREHLMDYIQKNPGATKLPRHLGTHQFTIDGVTEKRGIFPFYIWKWQKLTDFYHSLPPSERVEVDHFIQQFPHGLELLCSDMSRCRVERINNFLHVAAQMNSRL